MQHTLFADFFFGSLQIDPFALLCVFLILRCRISALWAHLVNEYQCFNKTAISPYFALSLAYRFFFSLLLSMTNRYHFNSLTNCRVIEKAVIYTDVMAVIKIICVLIL